MDGASDAPMKDHSLFDLKNSIAAKMRKGIRNFCNGDGSTSTLNQHKPNIIDDDDDDAISRSCLINSPNNCKLKAEESPPTLEELLLQLEMEEGIARQSKIAMRGRMSSVNNSDILRSARNALNQYPRFSLDGRDAMYRSSFRNLIQTAGRNSVSSLGLPATLAGESVVWCKPGVIGKLMGLDAMPVPITNNKQRLSSIIKTQHLRRTFQKHQMDRAKGGLFLVKKGGQAHKKNN